MKIKFVLLTLVFILCMSIVSASVTVTTTIDKENPLFGGPDTFASNPRADRSSDIDSYVDGFLSLKNDFDYNVTIQKITYTALSPFSISDLNITLTSPLTLEANSTGTLPLRARIPERLDAVERDERSSDYLEPLAFKVATLNLLDENDNIVSVIEVFMQRKNNLLIRRDRINIAIEDGTYRSYSNNDRVDKMRPGNTFNIELYARNDFSSRDDVYFDDYDFEFWLNYDTDSNWDWRDIELSGSYDGDIEFFNLRSGEDSRITIDDIELDRSIDRNGRYRAYGYLWGYDDYNAFHGQKIALDFDIERDRYDFVIDRASLSNDIVRCESSRLVSLDLRLLSFGRSGNNRMSLYVTSSDLRITESVHNLELSAYGGRDDTLSRRFDLVIPDNVKTGTYTIRTELFFNGDRGSGSLADIKDITLFVEDCSVEEVKKPVDDKEKEDEIVIEVPEKTPSQPSVPDFALEHGYISTRETSFRDTRAFDVLLVSSVIILSGLLIYIFVKFFF